MSMRHCRWSQRCSGVEAPLPLFTSFAELPSQSWSGSRAYGRSALEAWEGMEWLQARGRADELSVVGVGG